MKKINLLIIGIIFIRINPLLSLDTLEINIGPKKATVFLNGAQLAREHSLFLTKGMYTIAYRNLSPFLEDESIQYQLSDNAVLLEISSNLNYKNINPNGSYDKVAAKMDSIRNAIAESQLDQIVVKEKI